MYEHRGLRCLNCKEEREDISTKGKFKGYCHLCYKKLFWKPKLILCPRCKRMRPYQGRGLCTGCYSSVFQIENVRKWNTRLYHNVEPEIYKRVTKSCVICGFDKIVDLHHLDHNHDNNISTNLIGICPNHHKMIHHRSFQKEIFEILKHKGFTVPEGYKDDNLFKNL